MSSQSCVEAVMLGIGGTPNKVEVHSWITLIPGRRGGHAKDARMHGGFTVEGAYKARVLGFKLLASSTSISKIRVQHAYMHRQLHDLNPDAEVIIGGANYLYLSEHEDWVDANSVMGIITVVHAEIGELYRGGRSDRELIHESLFFYNAQYYPRQVPQLYGRLQRIPLPSFDSPEWPLPDMLTTETFRAKLRLDFRASMRPTTGSRQTHLQWFMPIFVMVDLFSSSSSIYKTRTQFQFKGVTEELMSSLMDKGWEEKVTDARSGGDVIKCAVDLASIVFRFHIARSTLYANFQYNRQRYFPESGWQPMDQVGPVIVVNISCEYENWLSEIEVGKDWQLTSVRQEIEVVLGGDCPRDFSMWIIQDGQTALKVNRRNEAKYIAAEVLPPRRLRIVSK